MMKKKLLAVLLAVFALGVWEACEYEFVKPETVDIDPNEKLVFADDVLPIFSKHGCDACHPSMAGLDFTPANAESSSMKTIDTSNPESSLIYTTLDGGHAGKSPTPSELAILLQWIEQVASDGGGGGTVVKVDTIINMDTTVNIVVVGDVSFFKQVVPVFKTSCLGCHGGGEDGFNPDLTTENAYASLTAKGAIDTDTPEESKLFSIFQKGGSHEGHAEIEQYGLFLGWIQQGAIDDTPDEIPEDISFVEQIEPILSNCTSCHGEDGADPVLTQYYAHENLKEGNFLNTSNPEQSKLYSAFGTGGKHEGNLSEEDMKLILGWIQQGAIYDGPPPPIRFSQEIQPVFTEKCASCHGSGSLNFTDGNSYNTIVNGNFMDTDNPESSVLYTKFLEGQSHKGRLSDSELELVLNWIKEGGVNN